MDSLKTRLLPEVLVENPIGFGAGKQRLPVRPLVSQVDTRVATLGVLASLQPDVRGQATIKK